jgi:hypothetical protein
MTPVTTRRVGVWRSAERCHAEPDPLTARTTRPVAQRCATIPRGRAADEQRNKLPDRALLKPCVGTMHGAGHLLGGQLGMTSRQPLHRRVDQQRFADLGHADSSAARAPKCKCHWWIQRANRPNAAIVARR